MTNECDYGPLEGLIGEWFGDSGMDVAPEAHGDDQNPYFETITYEAAGDVDNAGTQFLNFLRYRQVVTKKSTGEVFHNESGYLSWDTKEHSILLSFAIPRGVTVVAGGAARQTESGLVFEFTAFPESGISQSPFMLAHAKTTAFSRKMMLNQDQLTYEQTTIVEIYDRVAEHTDMNTLTRR